MVDGKPVLIGYRHYYDDSIQGASGIPERYVARAEKIFSEDLLKSVLTWAYEIIKKSFPNTNAYRCVISAPTSTTSAERKNISLFAIQCGFDLASVRELNIIMSGVYIEQLVGSLNARCLIICIDGHEISSYVTAIGDGIHEGLAVSRQDLVIDDGEYLYDNIRKSLDLVCSSVERDSRVSLVDIDYCMVTGVANKHIIELLKERLSGKVSLSTSGIVYEPNSIALGSAIISGVISGEVKEPLLLSIVPHSIVIRFENSGLVSSNEAEMFSENYIMLIPRNTTIPTKRSEIFSFCMSAGSSILACVDDFVRRKDDLHQYSCIDVFQIDNNGPENKNIQLEITVDVDADCGVDCSFKSVGPSMAGLVSIKKIVASDYLLISDNYHALYPSSGVQRHSYSLESRNLGLHAKENTDKTTVDCSSQVLPYADECLNRGQAKAELGDHQGAITDYTESIEIDPKFYFAYYWRGVAKAELGDHQGAIADYTESIALDPNWELAYYGRGNAKAELGDHQGAIADYTEVIALDPHLEFAYYQRGVSNFYLGDKDGAIADLSKAIEIDPQYAAAYYLRGGSKDNLGDKDGAISDLNKSIEIDPGNGDSYYVRGGVKNDLGDSQGAIADWSEAILLNPQYESAYLDRGVCKALLSDMEGAISDFNAVIAINPVNVKAFHERGACKHGLGDKHGAITDFNQAIAIDSQYAVTYHYRGTVKHELGDIEGAIADYRQAIAIDPEIRNPLDEVLEPQQPVTVEVAVQIASESPIFDGTLVFSKVLGFIRDENIAAQSESNESKKAVSILSTVGAVGATIAGFGPLGMVLSLGGRFAGTSSNKSKWSPKEIDETKECFDQSQREVKHITSRFGQPLGRFIRKDGDSFYIYSVFHSSNRGFNIITLAPAWKTAKCFTDDTSHLLISNVLAREHEELYNNLCNSLFPYEIVPIKGIRLVKLEDVKAGDPSSHHLSDIGDAYRFDCKDGSSFFGFKVAIPTHSDF